MSAYTGRENEAFSLSLRIIQHNSSRGYSSTAQCGTRIDVIFRGIFQISKFVFTYSTISCTTANNIMQNHHWETITQTSNSVQQKISLFKPIQ